MDSEQEFKRRMTEFEAKIDELELRTETGRTAPSARIRALRRLAGETRERHSQILKAGEAGREAVDQLSARLAQLTGAVGDILDTSRKLGDAADNLRLSAKYTQFDQEARQRELRGEGRDHPEDGDGGSC